MCSLTVLGLCRWLRFSRDTVCLSLWSLWCGHLASKFYYHDTPEWPVETSWLQNGGALLSPAVLFSLLVAHHQIGHNTCLQLSSSSSCSLRLHSPTHSLHPPIHLNCYLCLSATLLPPHSPFRFCPQRMIFIVCLSFLRGPTVWVPRHIHQNSRISTRNSFHLVNYHQLPIWSGIESG